MGKRRIIFDLNGTLFETINYESRLKMILNERGIEYSSDNLKKMLAAMQSYEDYYDHYTYLDYAFYLSSVSGLPLDTDFIKYFLSRADILAPDKIEEDVINTLNYLVKKYDLVVLTNYFAYAQYDQMAYLGISQYFNQVYGGEEIIKPQREAFLRACKPFYPEECVMIGDDIKKDVNGALNVPMDVIYFNRRGIVNNEREINNIKYLKKIL